MPAARYNTGKPELDYLLEFPTAVQAFCRVKELGAAKYDRGNWKKGGKPDHEYTSACLRHLLAFKSGEYYANDSGCAHLAHAMWNIMALMELNYPGQIIDQELFDKMIEHWKDRDVPADPPEVLISTNAPSAWSQPMIDALNAHVHPADRAEDDTYEGGGHDSGFAD